ncbi:UNVERIFIED_CONTAM: hypothetical protein GTU68_018026 [Idotea baltica]|nr:hypothetical protein [Idotea baltica]
MKNFVLIGAAGYIAPKHMRAIKETGNNLLAALDPNDSVGILDSYFPDADFFTEFERFDRHIEKLKRNDINIDYVSVCSPNYLHDAHIRFGLRIGASVICEKPTVLKPWNLDALIDLEKEYSGQVFNILQLRLHPEVIKLNEYVKNSAQKEFKVNLTYITSRGKWYKYSWKGDDQKSGGIATNIGIHFFDMLIWIFGGVKKSEVTRMDTQTGQGILTLERAKVKWTLSTDNDELPDSIKAAKLRTHRVITVDGHSLDLSKGFDDLHTESYQQIIDGHGFDLQEVKKSIALVNRIKPIRAA